MYKISVIIPVFNVETHLTNCLSSLINQTIGFENLEIIFIDDNSTDNSYKIIEDFTKEYENIKLYQTVYNSGSAGKPRNIGIEHATSPYIMFLDPDDTYYENACEILYSNAINTNADLVSGNYMEFTDGEKTKPMDYEISFRLKGNYLEINSIDECPQILTMTPALWVKIYKKEFLFKNDFKFLDYVIAEDLLFVCQCLIKAEKIVYIDVPIVKYIIRKIEKQSKSITATKNTRNLFGYIHVYNKLYNLLYEYNKDLAWMASIHLYFGTREMIVSHASKTDKLAFLHNSKNLYKPFLNHYAPQKGFGTISDLISQQKFMSTINVSEIMAPYLTKEDELLRKIQNKEIIILYDSSMSFEQKNNINKIINSIYKQGFEISLINLDIKEDEPIINNSILLDKEKYFEEYVTGNNFYKKLLLKKIKFMSIFDDFTKSSKLKIKRSAIPPIHNVELKNDFYITERYVITKEYSINKIRKYNYYNVREFSTTEINNIKTSKYNEKELKNILSTKNLIKSKLIEDKHILMKSIFNEEFNEEYVYSFDETECINIHHNNRKNKNAITLINDKEDFVLKFKTKKEFAQYFLIQYCINFEEKPFVINLTTNKDILNTISTLSHEIKEYGNYETIGWLDILQEAYTNSKIEEIEHIANFQKYKDIKLKHEGTLNTKLGNIQENTQELNDKHVQIKQLTKKHATQQDLIEKQDHIINNKNPKRINLLKEQIQKQQAIIEKQNLTVDEESSNIPKSNSSNLQDPYNTIINLRTTNEYYRLKSNPKKRLTLVLPYLYIIWKHKKIIENIKFYRKITKNEWLDIGYYLNKNTDIKRNKWCKILTPETHYTCHGFDEKRLPHPNYKNNLTKKEIISIKVVKEN